MYFIQILKTILWQNALGAKKCIQRKTFFWESFFTLTVKAVFFIFTVKQNLFMLSNLRKLLLKSCGTGQLHYVRSCPGRCEGGNSYKVEKCHLKYCVQWTSYSSYCSKSYCEYKYTRSCKKVDDNGRYIGSGSGCPGRSSYYGGSCGRSSFLFWDWC